MLLAGTLREAGQLAAAMFGTDLKSWIKGGSSPVSDADIAVNHFLEERLRSFNPDYGWLSEESADDLARLDRPRVWVVDPIDGTRAFLNKRKDWSISVALVEDGVPVLGCVYAPMSDEFYLAERGKGATLNASAINAGLHTKLPYDLLRDFAPIVLIDISPNVLIVHPALPVRTVKDLIALARARPGQLNFGSSGIAGSVHFAGEPCDMPAIRALSREYGFAVIEDASHAIGSRLLDQRIGDCEWSDITVLSFHPVKIVTTAEGGAALTRDPALAARLRLLRSHGITRDPAELEHPDEGGWYYEQQALGFNYRLTDVQAALGTSQLRHLEAWIARRHEIADRYDEALAGLAVRLPRRRPESRSALHLYAIEIEAGSVARRKVFDQMRAGAIGVNVHYIPVHLQPDFRRLGFRPGDFPAAEAYYAGALSLPMYATLTTAQQDRVVATLRAALETP